MKRNNYLSIVVCLLSIFLFGFSSLFAEFAGGKGTFMEPWLIETAEHLSNVKNYIGVEYNQKFFKQIADIDLDVAPWNTGDGWEPIGIAGKHFYGTYDGDGHAVTGLYIRRPSTKNVGLFGFCMNANIKNLRVVDFDVEGDTWVGGIVGDFSGSESNPAGVGKLTNCFASGKVKGLTRVGGLAGYSVRSEINRCGAIAEVTSIHSTESYAGGLIGFVSTNGKVSNCYAFGVVTSEEEASGCGGLIGTILSATISKSYSTTSGIGGKGFGGLIGLTEQSNCSYCYWDTTASMTNESKGGEGRTTEQMTFPHGHNTYVGWDFTETWFADVTKEVNNGYPYHGSYKNIPYAAKEPEPANEEKGVDIYTRLIWVPDLNEEFNNMPNGFYLSFGTDNPPTNIINKEDLKWATEYEFDAPLKTETTYYWQVIPYNKIGELEIEDCPIWNFETYFPGEYHFGGGSGTEEDPWRIATIDHLNNIRTYLGEDKYYLQTADIDLGVSPWNEEEGWIPFGKAYGNHFNGTYDGGNHSITGLYINRPNENYQSLFGYLAEGAVKRLNVVGCHLIGKDYVGAIAGVAIMDTQVIGCHSQGIISGNNSLGGIIGRAKDSFVQYCDSFAEVKGYNQIGGLIGDNQSSTVDNCFARGKVEGIDRVGGLIGNNYMSSVKHSYATGKVTGSINFGGLAGRISEGIEEDINNYWDTESSELQYSALGQGRTTKEMIYPYAENTYLQWNFRDIWAHDEDGELNDGYPYLRTDIVVSANKEELASVNKVRMSNYPNPFNPETTISFELGIESEVELSIFNVKGQKVVTLFKGLTKPGVNKVLWDGVDQMGSQVPSGIYLYKLSTPFGTFNKKMMVLK